MGEGGGGLPFFDMDPNIPIHIDQYNRQYMQWAGVWKYAEIYHFVLTQLNMETGEGEMHEECMQSRTV